MSYIIPIGPYHPALEEPVHAKLYTEGEIIKDADVFVGYNHRGIEKLATERNANEEERKVKEAERIAKETERNSKEAERRVNEDDRIAKEVERNAKEAERQANEATRVANEEARLANEEAFAVAVAGAQKACDEAKKALKESEAYMGENIHRFDGEAVTMGSVALGEGSVAGARGFGVKAFDHSKKQLTIALKHPVSGATASPDYAVGDMFSILNGSHYAFCGKIDAISVNNTDKTATITYTPTTAHGTNSSREDPWWVFDSRTILYPVRAIFWIPEKPLVGYDLTYEGEDAFPNAVALNGGLASAKGAVVNGEGSAAGGNWAAIFGELIRAAYGNLSSGRENDSTGLHSGLIGRWLKNYGDYNFLANKAVEVLRGNCNAGFGSTNTLHQGDCNGFVGYLLKIFGDLNGVCGYGHELGDAEKGYKAHYNTVGGKNHKIGKERSVSYANVSGVANEVNHEGVDVSGWNHKSSCAYQVLRGFGSTPDADAAFILARDKNLLTMGINGTRADVGTDAVVVDFLKKKLDERIDEFFAELWIWHIITTIFQGWR